MSKQSSFKTVARVVKDFKPIAGGLALAALLCAGTVFLSVLCPQLVGDIIDLLYDYGNGLPLDLATTGRLCLLLALAYFGSGVLSAALTVVMNTLTSRYYTRGLRVRLSDKLRRLPVSFVDNTPNGEFMSRMMDDVSNMSGTIYIVTETLIDGFLRIIAITVVLFTVNVYMALAVLVFVPLSMFLSAFISGKSEKSWHQFRKVNGRLSAFVEEDFSGFDTVKAFNLEQRQKQKNDEITEEYYQKLRRGRYLTGLVQPIIAFTDSFAYVAVCLLGALLVLNDGGITVGQLVEVILFAKMLAGPLESIANGMGSVQHMLACASRVYGLLDMEEMNETGCGKVPQGNGEVDFSHVYFSYDKDKPLIKDLNVHVKAGQKVAIVGPTGGGKTTIVNLLMRFYDVDSGKITIDGVDIAEMDRAELRKQFGMVLQDTWLFNGTVYENIAYGKENATREEVMEAARRARIDYFIDSLPNGYDTVINEESTNISGGQKQLLTIARSYLADRKMLILDEATSNVDTRTEIIIQKTMDELLKGRTSFVIAHRLSTIVNADLILVVNDGEVVEQGTHKQLLAQNGFYTKIYNSQYELLK